MWGHINVNWVKSIYSSYLSALLFEKNALDPIIHIIFNVAVFVGQSSKLFRAKSIKKQQSFYLYF